MWIIDGRHHTAGLLCRRFGGGSARRVAQGGSRVYLQPGDRHDRGASAADNWPGGTANLPGGGAVLNNKLYTIGGFTGAGMIEDVYESTHTPPPAQWVTKADLPVQRGYVPAVVWEDLLHRGGSGWNGTTLNDTTEAFRFDPVANTWSAIPSIPRATGETRAVAFNNQVWVLAAAAMHQIRAMRSTLRSGHQCVDPRASVHARTPQLRADRRVAYLYRRRIYRVNNRRYDRGHELGRLSVAKPVAASEPVAYTDSDTATPTPTPATPTPTPTPATRRLHRRRQLRHRRHR